jgi:nicotinamidase-related amidase
MFFCFLLILLHRVSSSPPPVPKRSRSMTPPSLRMQAGKAPRSRTVIRQPSRQSWTPRTLHPQKRNLVLQAGLLHAAAQTVFDKTVYSAFGNPQLHQHLRERQIDTLIVSGSETDVCVLSSILAAVDYG